VKDDELNALVAEKVAGIRPRKQMVAMNATGDGMALWEDKFTRRSDVLDFCKRHPQYKAVERDQWPDYLHDSTAVIALLKGRTWNCVQADGDYWIRVSGNEATASSFNRAAVLALLAAHGAAEGGGK
jgi:hypothetical protein